MDKKFFILIACFIFNGCGWNSDPGEKSNLQKDGFEIIEDSYINGNTRIIVRDTETNVLYIDCYYTIVPLINPDGTPKLYGK